MLKDGLSDLELTNTAAIKSARENNTMREAQLRSLPALVFQKVESIQLDHAFSESPIKYLQSAG